MRILNHVQDFLNQGGNLNFQAKKAHPSFFPSNNINEPKKVFELKF